MVGRSLLRKGNRYLRKYRKWPHSPYKTKWHESFSQQQAMGAIIQASSYLQHPQHNLEKPFLLLTLIDSFNTYKCDATPNSYSFVIKTLTQNSQWHCLPPVLDHLQNFEKFETPEYILTNLIRTYGDADKIQEAHDLFHRIPKFRCVPSVVSLNTLLSVLCRKREYIKMVPEVLLKSQFMNIRIDESTFRVLIKALCRINKVEYAVEILNDMISDGYSPDEKIFSLIISSLCKQKELTSVEARGVLEGMRKLGFCPSMMDYSNLINFLVKKGRGEDAMSILNQMKVDGIKPDIVCYTMVLNGIIAEGDYGKADKLFDELLVLGLLPDLYTYNVYVNGLCKQNNVDEALKIVTSMQELGCRPNVVTYNTLLGALFKVRKSCKARELVREMGVKGIGLNLHTYRIILDGFISKAEFTEACMFLEEMLDKRFYPHTSTIDNLLNGMCQRGSVTDALELMNKVLLKNLAPGPRAWEALLLHSTSELSFPETTLIALMDHKPPNQSKFPDCL